MAELSKAQLKLWVYGGDINARPENPNYTLTKTKLANEDIIVFEISELIKDFVEIKFDGNYEAIEQTKWVFYEVTRTYDDDTTDTYSEHAIAFRGYGELVDGINPELSKDLMMSNTVVNNYCGQPITVPFYTREDGVMKVSYIQDQDTLEATALGSAEAYTIAQETRLNPPSSDIIKIDKTATVTTSSDDSTSINEAPANTDKITYTTSEGVEKSILIQCIDECKNIPHKISFINKFGVMQDIWFFARRKDSISSQREQYKKTTL